MRERNSKNVKCKRRLTPLFSVKLKCVFFFKNPRNECQKDCVIIYPQKSFLELLFPDLCVSYILTYQIPNKDIYRLLTHVLCNFTEKKGNSSNSDITNNISSSYDLGFGSGNQLFQERVRVQASHDCFALWSKIFYSCQCYDHHCWWTIR